MLLWRRGSVHSLNGGVDVPLPVNSNMKWNLLLVCLFWLQGRCMAAPSITYIPHAWGVEEGLPQHVVSAVKQTRMGHLWCGTYNGLARFDGVKFTVFDENSTPGLPGRGVSVLWEDRQGTLWVGSDSGGVARVIGQEPVETPSLSNPGTGAVQDIAEDAAGDLWIVWVDGTVMRWRDQLRFTAPPEVFLSEPELRLVLDGSGVLWLVHRYGFAAVTPQGIVPAETGISLEGWGLQRTAPARRGGLWVISELKLRRWQDGRWVEDLGTSLWETPEDAGRHFVSVLLELQDGRLLMGMNDGGVSLGVPGQKILRYTRQTGLPHDWIRCVTEDREGNLWLGTGGAGLVALRPRRVEMITVEPDQTHHNIQSIITDRTGALWVATEGGGLFHQDLQTKQFIRQESLPTRFVWSVMEDPAGRIWAGTWGRGLFVREPVGDGSFAPAPFGDAPRNRVTVLHVGRDNCLWVGGSDPLRRLTDSGWVTADAQGHPFAPGSQRCLVEDQSGGMWIGFYDGTLRYRKNGSVQTFDRSHGLPGDSILTILPMEENTAWVGTAGGGLLRVHRGRVQAVTTIHGLPHDVITHLLPGPGGYLWAGSYGGICRLSLTELRDLLEGRRKWLNVLTLKRSDGMASLECNSGGHPGACALPDGRLCFPTNKGLALVDPENIRLNPLPPPVLLESLTADIQSVSLKTNPQLGPGITGVSLTYTALSFTDPTRVRFRTWLEGLETTWQEAGHERQTTYRYLAPGTYHFRVTACNNDGVWNETGASLAFTILPHFWQTGWFFALSSLATAGSVGSLVYATTRRRNAARLARVERVHALERERARIARDIHDDLGSGLTRIMLLSQSARSEMPGDHPVVAELDNVCRAAEGLTRTMDEVVWAVDPRHDSLESLIGYTGSAAQELMQSARIRFRLEAPDNLRPWPLTADCRHSLFLAGKEALTNIVRHAQAKTARVTFKLEPDAFTLTIEDDGIGFDPTAAHAPRTSGGHGLTNMQARLAEAGGTCTVASAPGQGTRITFRLPGSSK